MRFECKICGVTKEHCGVNFGSRNEYICDHCFDSCLERCKFDLLSRDEQKETHEPDYIDWLKYFPEWSDGFRFDVITKENNSQSARLMRVHLLLLFEGSLSRQRIMDVFSVSNTRATNIIREYREVIPEEWLHWSSIDRCHYKTRYFDEYIARKDSPEVALKLLGDYSSIIEENNSIFIEDLPTFQVYKTSVLSMISMAVNEQKRIEVDYLVNSVGCGKNRKVIDFQPHSIFKGFQGGMYVRGFCTYGHGFQNIKISNIIAARIVDQPIDDQFKRNHDDDHEWADYVDVVINGDDLQLETLLTVSVVKCRKPMLLHFLFENNIGIDEDQENSGSYLFYADFSQEVREYLRTATLSFRG